MTFSFGNTQPSSPAGQEDLRYRIKVLLIAERRPRYWIFHCLNCGLKLCELSGTVLSLVDVADGNSQPDYQPAPIAIECRRKICRYVYEFETLSGK